MISFSPALLAKNMGIIARVLQSLSIGAGVALFLGGMFQFKRFAQTRTFMSHQMTVATPLMMIIAAVLFLMLPSFSGMLLHSFWGTTSPLRYSGGTSPYQQVIPPVLMFVRIIGVVAIMRGLMLLSRSGRIGGQPGTMGRCMIHLFTGILCMHIVGTTHLLRQIMGFS